MIILQSRYFHQWINVKKAYAEHTNHFAKGMTELLKNYNLQLQVSFFGGVELSSYQLIQGRHHSGIDDVANICQIVRCLGVSGHHYRYDSCSLLLDRLCVSE